MKVTFTVFFCVFFSSALFSQLDATFSSPDSDQCPNNLFTLTATNTTYSSYNWNITGPGGYSSSPTGSSIAFGLITSGLYSVTLTVSNGGLSTTSPISFLTVYSTPTISYVLTPTSGCTPLNVSFNGGCTAGSGTLQSFQITTGTGTTFNVEDFSYTYTSAGTFTPAATVTNSFGCYTTQNLSPITVSQSASLSSPLNPNSICSGSVFNYTSTSATSGCTFSWTRASNAGIVQGASSGTGNISETLTLVNPTGSNVSVTYVVTTTAPNGCQTQQNVLVNVRALPSVSISPSSLTICNGSTGTLTATGTPSGGTYAWSNSLGSAAAASVTAAGTYSVTYSSGGCSSAPANATVTVTSAPSVTISLAETSGTANNDGTICSGGIVTLTANPSAGGGTYLWLPGGQTTAFITVAPTATTAYTVTYTLGCPSALASTQIVVKALPTNNYLSSVTSACSAPVTTNYTSTATAPSGSTISSTNWTFTGGTPNSGTGLGPISVTYNASGAYGITLTSTSSDGCVATNNYSNAISISSTAAPTSSFSVSPSTSQCLGSNFTFTYTGTGADSIRWDLGNGVILWTQENVPLAYGATGYLTPGSYAISMTPWTTIAGNPPQLGCSGSVTTQFITIMGPKASFTVSTVNCSNQFSRTFTNNTTGTTGSTTYSWSFPSGTPATANTFGPHTVTWVAQGSYTVTLTATDATTGCPASTTTATVNVNSNTGADFQSTLSGVPTTSICLGTALTFTNTTPSSQYNALNQSTISSNTQWDWNTNTGTTFPNSSASLRGTPKNRTFSSANLYAPGQYGIAMLNIDNNLCRDTIIKTNYITVHGVVANLSIADTVCAGQSFQPTDNSTAPMSSISSRVWNWGDGTANTTGNSASPTHTYVNTGTYTLTLTVTDNSGIVPACSTVITKTIVVRKPTASFSVNRNYICNNQTVVVTNNSTGSGLTSYAWSATSASPASATGSGFGTFTFNSQGNQSITLTITDNLGCIDDTTLAISVFDVIAAASATPTSFSCFNPPNLVNFTNLSTNNVDNTSAIWNFGNGQTSTVWNPSTTYSVAGTYNVTLTVSSLTGCSSTQTVATITVGGPSGTIDVTNASLTGCTCYNAIFSVTTGSVTEAKLLYGDGGFINLTPNSTQTINYSYCNSGTTPISFTPSLYINNGTCNGFITSTETITINPKPAITAMTNTVCSGVAFTSTPANGTNGVVPTGTTYSWSAPTVTGGMTGGASGSAASSLAGTLTNPTNTAQTATYTVTPTSGTCAGTTFTLTVTINPKPTITAMTNTVCSGVAFTSTPANGTNGVVPTGTTYSWSAPTVTGGMTGGVTGSAASSLTGTLTNPTNTVQTATYTVTPTSGSCSGTTFTVTVTVNPTVTFTPSFTNPTVCNATDGTITLSGLQANTSYTYTLNGGSSVPATSSSTGQIIISSLSATTYAIIVTNATSGCSSIAQSVSLTNPGAPDVNDIADQALCGGSYTLPVITGTNLNGNQAYYTGPNGTGSVMSGSISTSQTIYIYASTPGGCSDQETFTVTINPLPTITGTLTVCVGSTTQLTGSGTANATTPWTSSTSVNATVSSTGLVSGLSVGSTTITYMDNNGCQKTAIVTVNSLPTFTATPTDPTLCNGTNGSILLTGLQNSTSYTYSLNGAAAVAVTTTASGQATISSLGAGTYTLTVTLVSTGCISATQTVSLTNPGAPNVNDITDQVLCGGSYTLPVITGTNLSGNQSYYTGTNGTGTPIAEGTVISASQTIYIYASTPGGCSDQETFSVTINALPTITGTLTVCVGSTIQLTGSGIANATTPWTSSTPVNATVSSTGLVSGLSVGSTTITYMDNNGCQKTAIVTVNSLPTFTATPTDPTLCNGTNGSILLTGLQNSTSYTYSLNGAAAVAVTTTASGQATISSLGAGTYTLTVTLVSTGCISATQTVSLTNPGAPNVNDIIDQVLCGGSYTLPVITGTNLSGNQSYYTGTNGTGTPIAALTVISTSQTIYIYASTPGGCSDQETFTVTINPLPTISGTLSVCVGSTIQLTGSGTANATTPWTSSIPANATVNSTGLVTGVAVGNTTITYTDNNGCITTAVVTVNPVPTFTATPTNPTLCNGTDGSILLTGLQNSTSYTYSLNGAAAVAFTTSASGQATISSLGAGTYTLTVTMVSTGGVSATQTLSLTNPGAPNVNDITDQVLCGGSYTLPLITGTNLNGNQAYYTGPNGTGSVLSGSISTSQTVYIYASTPGGCSDEETFMVTINALPTISGTLTVCIGSTTQLTGSGTANATTPWTSSTPANATVSSTGLVSGLSVGSTTITYMDNNGCITTAVVTVNSLPTFTATPTDPTLCNGTNGSILLTGLQNSTSYTYSLNGAAAVAVTTTASGQATISSLGSGTYTLTVTLVSTGCISATQTTSLTNPGAPNVNDIIDQVLCGGSYTLPVITGTNLNGNQAYYSQPNGPNGTGSALTGSISTSQTVYIYASTPGGCSDEETFSVTIQTIPTLSAGSTLCVGNTLQLSASTVGTWVSNTPSIASVIPATGVATGLLSGNATFTFTDASTGCTATTSTVSVNATPTVNAGTDVTICSSTGFVSLSGSFGGSASSVNWTGGNGGVFSSPASVISLYTFSSTDISSGSVWLYLTTNDPAGDCSFVKDSLLVTINPSAIVNAGVDQVTCGTTSVSLSGTVGGSATSVTWSTSNGTGIFSSLNALNASYTPSNNDIATVYINIVLTSNDPLGPCPAVTDTVVISVDPPATANAGIDFVSCSNTPINLNGLFGGSASTGIWTGSSNPVVNNPTTSNVIYTPSVSELSIGSVTLTFTTNDPAGSCLAVSDQVTISFSSPAIVNAGNDTTICSGSTIGLNGTFGGLATSATWFSAGTPPGVFTGSSLYTPSQAEITVGTAVLTYTTNNPAGPCPAVSDQKIITINPTPTVSGLNAITVCSGTALNHLLSGVVSSNYTWIAADNTQTIGETTTLQTTSSITDVIINQTTIDQVLVYTITPTAVGTGCVGSPQTLTVTVKPTPTLIDPADQTLCAYTSTQSVSFASNLAGTTFSWAVTPANLNIGLSNDTGNSIPSFTAQNTFTTTINATVTVTPTSNSSCAGTPQTFDFIILPVSTVVDPSDQVVCAGTLTSTITFIGSDPATIYNWTSNNTTIGVSLSSPGAGNISAFAGVNNGITDVISTFTVTPSLNGCLGTPQTFTIKVKPLPTMQTPASQTVCVGNSTSQVVFASSILGTTYSWTNSNSNIGLAGASVGNVTFIPSFVSQNSTNLIDTADIIVIPSFNGCAGTAVSFQIIVNPVLQVTPITNVVYCAGDLFPGVSFTGNVPTASYSWSTDNISVGFPISGQSNVPGINSFTTQNSGSLTQIANVTVTPSLPGCQGTPFIFTLTVKPLPTVFIAPLSQAHCHGSSTIPVDFTGNLDPVVTYTWSQDNTSISAVFLGSGTNDIPSFIAINTGLVSQTSTFIVVPTYNGCTGIQATFSITVNPIPTVANVLDQNWCAGQPSDPVNFTGSLGSTATYNWTQTNQYIGINTPPAFGDIASFTTQNLSTIIQTDTITVTPNFNGCNGIPEVFVITVRPTPTVYPINDQSLCVYTYTNPVVFNGNMGSVATYSWTNNNTVINSSISSGNDSIPSFQVQNPGNTIVVATITVTPEAYGCFGTPETFTISSVDPIPTVIPTADITLCAGTQTGTIDFQPNDPTIIYHWTNDNTSIGLASAGATDISNFQLQNTGIANQTAHVIVTPEYNGCFGLSDTFDITVKPIPNVFITPLYDSLCANQNSAYIDFTGDISGTNFSWINSNTSIGLSGSGSGDIPSFLATNISNNIETGIITVTPDFNGCSGTPQTTTITVNPISTVVLATQPIYYCHGDSISDIIFNGNNSGTIYQWTNNNTAINLPSSGVGNILSFPVTNTDVVNYEAIIAVQPVLNGCPGVLDSFKIIVKPIPTVYTPLNQFLCANQASTVVDFQGNMTDSTVFTWFNTNVSIGLLNPTITGGSGNIPSFVATNVGQLTQVADVIVIPTLNGCIGIADTFQYTAYPISTVNLVNDTVCTGDFVNQLDFVGSNPTATYEWTCYNNIGLNPLTGLDSIPGFTAFNSGTVQQDGLIVVTPYVGGCPGINDTLHIVVNPRPIINASLDQTVCANDVTDPVVFSSNISGTTYAWQNSNISIGLASSDITDIATFTSINTDATGLIPQIGTIIVTPSFNGCAGLNDTLSITVNPLPVVNAGLDTTLCFGQHVTLTGSGTAISYLWDNGALNGIPYYPTTTTLFTVVGTDNNLCQNTDQILVTYLLDLPPVVSAGPDTAICFSEPITLNGVGNALVYNWNNDVLDGQSFNPAQTDTYIVIGTAANGCIASDTMELIVHPLPIVSINVVDSILCAGEQALLWGSGALTYVWDNNITDNVPFIPTETDIYTMIGYDQFGCTDTASITVVVNPMPNVLFSSDMNFGGCLPFSPTFTDLTGANGNGPTSASVMWYFGNGASSNQLGSETNIYDSYGCFDVTLVSTTAEACTDSLTLQDYVCVNELVASFTPDPLSQPISNPVFEFTNTSVNATEFQWFFGDGTESDFVSTKHTYDSIGCYQVVLVVSAQDGCTDTAVQVVCVKDELLIYVPNTFTPDGDGLNDIFLPVLTAGYRPGTYEFAIYNRWGERFFYTEDVDQGWDGTFKGNEVQVGTYTYTIKFKSSMDNNVYTFNGHVNLIR